MQAWDTERPRADSLCRGKMEIKIRVPLTMMDFALIDVFLVFAG